MLIGHISKQNVYKHKIVKFFKSETFQKKIGYRYGKSKVVHWSNIIKVIILFFWSCSNENFIKYSTNALANVKKKFFYIIVSYIPKPNMD